MKSIMKIAALVLSTHSVFALTPGDYQKEMRCFQALRLLHLTVSSRDGNENFYDKTSGLLAMPKADRSNGFYIIAPNGASEVKFPHALPPSLSLDNVQTYVVRIGLPGKPKVAVGYNLDTRFKDSSNDSIVWQRGVISDAVKNYIVEMPMLDAPVENVRKAILGRYNVYISNVYQRYQRERKASFMKDAEAYRQIFGSNPDPAWATDPAGGYMKVLEICGAVPGLEQSVKEELAKFDSRSSSPVSMRRNKAPVKRSIATVPEGDVFERRPTIPNSHQMQQ